MKFLERLLLAASGLLIPIEAFASVDVSVPEPVSLASAGGRSSRTWGRWVDSSAQ